MAREKFIRPDIHVLALGETEHWNLPEFEGKIERIETVYLFDSSRHHHLCEMTPSYELIPIETRAILKTEFDDDETLRDAVDLAVMDSASREVTYMHVHTVEGIIERIKAAPEATEANKYLWRYHHYGDPFPEMTVTKYRKGWDWKDKAHVFYDDLAQAFRENAVL